MTTSLVIEININGREKLTPGSVLAQRLMPSITSLFQFISNNPTVQFFNESCNGSDFTYIRSELKFVDQAQLDLYLASENNVKSVIDSMNADPDITAAWSASGTTCTMATVENTTTSRGLLTLDDLAQVIANY